jgi:hypothetical protein
VAEDWSHGADAGLTEAPQGPWLAAKARMREISRRSPPRTKRTKGCPCRDRLQQHIRGFRPNPHPRCAAMRSSSGSAPSTRKICGSFAGKLLLTPRWP